MHCVAKTQAKYQDDAVGAAAAAAAAASAGAGGSTYCDIVCHGVNAGNDQPVGHNIHLTVTHWNV